MGPLRILTVLICFGGIYGLVRFSPGFEYHYTFKSSQTLGNVAVIKLQAHASVLVRAHEPSKQICQLKILNYDIVIKSEDTERQPHAPMNFNNNSLFFEMKRSGEIVNVMYPQGSDETLVVLKKMLLSSLSTKLMATDKQKVNLPGHTWGYKINETSHEGEHEALYQVKASDETLHFTKTKVKPTLSNAKESFVKNINYSLPLHVPQQITIHANFTSPTESKSGFIAKDGLGDPISGNKHYHNEPKIDIPGMHTSTKVTVMLVKTQKVSMESDSVNITSLVTESLTVGNMPLPRKPLKQVEHQIYGNISCLITSLNTKERVSPCYYQLIEVLRFLSDADLSLITSRIMTNRSLSVQKCFIDALASIESNHTQNLLVIYVFDGPTPNPDLLMRTLIHFVDLKLPPSEMLLETIETRTLLKPYYFKNSSLLTRQVNERMLFTLGSLMDNVKRWDPKRAQTTMRKIEDRLGVHDPDRHRVKRDTMEHTDYYEMVQSQAVYLWSLGNAAVDSSYEHILSYVNHSDSPILWKKGAVHSIANYPTQQAAEHLLGIAVSDADDDIRRAAILAYRKHPMGEDFLPFLQKDGSLPTNVNATYEIRHRMKRSLSKILARIWKGFHFKLASPSVDWRKNVGGSAIGASFGLVIKNLIDIVIRPLSGHILVDVHDGAWVTVNLGIINYKLDIFRAEICFKGKIEYELNILKEFGFESIQEYAGKFAKTAQEIFTIVSNSVKAFNNLIVSVRNFDIGEIFEQLKQTLKDLPKKILNFPKIGRRVLGIIKKYSNMPPVVESIKRLVERVRNLFKDIKNDVTNFYETIIDGVTVTLPWAWDEIKTAFNDIIQAVGRIVKNPKRAINDIGRSATRIFTAIGGVVDLKDKLAGLNFFKKENQPYWFDVKGVIEELWNEILTIKDELEQTVKSLGPSSWDDYAKRFTGVEMKALKQHILTEIKDALMEELGAPFDIVRNLLKPVLSIYELFTDSVKNVKEAWTLLKKGYEQARTLIELVFGMKIDKGFPRKYLESSSCGDGFYESNGKGNYKHPGVDSEAAVGSEIVAPFEGTLTKTGPRQVTIKIKTARNMIVILENVESYDHLHDQVVGAGEGIGKLVHPQWCQDGHVHMSIMKLGDDGGYIDPSRHMERRDMPPPEWRQACDNYILVWKAKVVSQSHLAGIPTEDDQTPDQQSPPDLSNLSFEVSPTKRKKRFLDGIIDKLNELSTSLGLPSISQIKDLFNFRFGDITLEKLFDFMDKAGMSQLKDTTMAVLSKLNELKKGSVCERPENMDSQEIREKLENKGISTSGDDRETLIKKYLQARPACFGGQGHISDDLFCKFDEQCLRLSCCMDLDFFVFKYAVLTYVNFNPCTGMLTLGLNEWSTSVDVSPVNFKSLQKSAIVKRNINLIGVAQLSVVYGIEKDYEKIMVSLGVSWCSSKSEECRPLVHLLKKVPLKLLSCSENTQINTISSASQRETETSLQFDVDRYKKMTIGAINKLIELSNLDVNIITDIMESLRDAFQQWLRDKIQQLLVKIFGNEFNLFDSCVNGLSLGFGPYHVTFFDYTYIIPVGPIPLQLRFGAGGKYGVDFQLEFCIMSMKATARVTPGVGAQVWGAVGVRIVFLTAELRLTGYLLETYFPTKATIKFQRFPLDVSARMDLHLIPLRLELRALLIFEMKIRIPFKTIHIKKVLINILIWQYSIPAIKKNIFNLNDEEPDKTPPNFISYVKSKCQGSNCPEEEEEAEPEAESFVNCYNCDGKEQWKSISKRDLVNAVKYSHRIVSRSVGNQRCTVEQLSGRDRTEPAFNIELDVTDDRAEVDLDLCVGTVAGGCNVVNHEPLGSSGVMNKRLVSGVPVYFTVCGSNSAGMLACTQCDLPTYDTTLPGGRVTVAATTSSHPHVVKGSALATDDSDIRDTRVSVGFGHGVEGDQIVPFESITSVSESGDNVNGGNDPLGLKLLKFFTSPRLGKLISKPISVGRYQYAEACAKDCLALPPYKCLGFNYDYGLAGLCELLEEVEGYPVERHVSGSFHHFERLGIGHTSSYEYRTLQLRHNYFYFVNFYMRNTLHYERIITSEGILVDLTHPEPGHLENVTMDRLYHETCEDFVPKKYVEKCVDISPLPNYRAIVDGPGSRTVGNGPNHGIDIRYTRANRMAGAHWDGIYDNETGILVYTWGLGSGQCQDDVHPHHDPHDHLADESEWTHTGVVFPLNLADGDYHVILHAMNKIDYGGPLALAVCHSQPFTVDTTPPLLSNITNVNYDQHSYQLSFVYNGSDPLSHIMRVEFGLGRSKRDTYLVGWQDAEHESPMIRSQKIPDGVPAWVKLRLTNHVELRTAGHADRPILVDTSPPIAGTVLDGNNHHTDLMYQSSTATICAAWLDFYDPESGIFNYIVGIGTSQGLDDIVTFEELGTHSTDKCWAASLEHNHKYYATVTAIHGGHDSLSVKAYSNGVLVDATAPVAGSAIDNVAGKSDIQYSSEPATAAVSWKNFYDPESGVEKYIIQFLRTSKGSSKPSVIHSDTLPSSVSEMTVHHLRLHHGDFVRVSVTAVNGAKGQTTILTDGFTVDLTEPTVHELSDGPQKGKNIQYTASLTTLSVTWNYTDPESGIKQINLGIYEAKSGSTRRIYPKDIVWKQLEPTLNEYTSSALAMELGLHYHFKVGAVNQALLAATHQTDGVLIDNTPPEMVYVRAGVINGESEELEDGYVIHTENEGIWISWLGVDHESDIDSYFMAVGTSRGGEDVQHYQDVGRKKNTFIPGSLFQLTNKTTNTPVYYVSVQCKNGASQASSIKSSSPIRIVAGNQAGVVMDGPSVANDVDVQLEVTALSSSFYGFNSERDGIAHYYWAVGTKPFSDDMMAYTDEGIVEDEETTEEEKDQVYHVYMLLPLTSGKTYFTTVRAKTGAGDVLESSSNGVTVDTSAPTGQFVKIAETMAVQSQESAGDPEELTVYQKEPETLTASWNVTDQESTISVLIQLSSYPGDLTGKETPVSGIGSISTGQVTPQAEGYCNILSLHATNQVGLESSINSPAVVTDSTPPVDGQLSCPMFSSGESQITCTWADFHDKESGLAGYLIGIGLYEGDDSVLQFEDLPASTIKHSLSGVGSLDHDRTYFITLIAVNQLGLRSVGATTSLYIDTTPPKSGRVVELSDTSVWDSDSQKKSVSPAISDFVNLDVQCQKSVEQLNFYFQPFTDPESAVSRYEVAVGVTSGGIEIQDFEPVEPDKYHVTLTGLDLSRVKQAFVTVRGYNGAGLHTDSTSNGVYISRISAGLQPLDQSVVYDGDVPGKDLDYQSHNDGLNAHWDLKADPCPTAKLEWRVDRADGRALLPYSALHHDVKMAEADELQLTDGDTYFVTVRATNLLGHTYSIRSDGITIQVEPLLPGVVRDGDINGFDLNYQQSVTTLSGNWDSFGKDADSDIQVVGEIDSEIGKHQIMDHYEVAIGTDRRYPSTRDNIRPFIDVGLNKSHTFSDLTLISKTAMYYFTVRAYSVSTAMVEVTSNGIQVGHGAQVISIGEVDVQRFISSEAELSFTWKGFLFVNPTLFYQWGIGTSNDQLDEIICTDLEHDETSNKRSSGNWSHLFDVKPLTTSVQDTYIHLSDLTLQHGRSYHIAVVAVDQTGGCIMATNTFTVDVTPPTTGNLIVGTDFGKSVLFTRDPSTLTVTWEDYSDPESDIEKFEILLIEGTGCTPPDITDKHHEFIEMSRNFTSKSYIELGLQSDVAYYVFLRVTNGAGSSTLTVSKPLMLDLLTPVPGNVVDGTDIMKDIKFQSSLTDVTGTFLYMPSPHGLACPDRKYSMFIESSDWWSVQNKGFNADKNKNVWFQKNLINYNNPAGAALGYIRDVTSEKVLAAALQTEAHLGKGGKYQFHLKPANGKLRAVTSVCVHNGPSGEVWDYENMTDTESGHTEAYVIPDEMLDDTSIKQAFSYHRLRGFGFQIRPAESEDLSWNILVWFKNHNDTIITNIPLDFDPSVEYHSYKMVVNENEPNPTQGDWTLSLYIDDRMLMFNSGVPDIASGSTLQIHVWNDEDYVPQLPDPFHPPQTATLIRNIELPPIGDKPCRFVKTFRGGSSPVEAVFAGIGSEPLQDDIVPFTQIDAPCIPCSMPCLECSQSCDETASQTLNVHLSGLNLQLPQNTSSMTVHHLSVKLITGSSQEAIASSNGFYLDGTPPNITYIVHVDMAWSDMEPSDYQGNNNTISCVWEAEEQESEIVEYLWAIGSSPGSVDLQPFVSVGTQTYASNDKLEGKLENKKTYYVTIKAVNEAGLVQTRTSTGVTVLLDAPDESETETSVAGTESIGEEGSNKTVRTKSQDKLHVNYDQPKSEKVDGIYFSLGTGTGTENDVFPERQVGYNNSGHVDISSKGLSLDENEPSYNISDMRDKTGRTKRSTESGFLMEPGRSIFINMEACNVAHKCGSLNNKAIIIMRDSDNKTSAKAGDVLRADLQTDHAGQAIHISTVSALQQGVTLVYGGLSESDLQQTYVSAASNTFHPYIVNPQTTTDQTDRILYRRITSWTKTSFFITTLPEESISEPIQIIIPYNKSVFTADQFDSMEPKLLYWDAGESVWKDASLACPPPLSTPQFDKDSGKVTINVCGDSKPGQRSKRSTGSASFTGPSQFTLAGVNPNFVNNPPVLTSTKMYYMFEDSGTLQVSLTATDPEGDQVSFRLNSSKILPLGGSADLESNGKLSYRPCTNCYGTEHVIIQLIEKRFDSEPALITNELITIEVNPVNDNPVLFVSAMDHTLFIPEQFVDVVWIIEQNDNNSLENIDKTVMLGGFDVDGTDMLDIVIEAPKNGILTMSNATRMIRYEKKQCVGKEAVQEFINATLTGVEPKLSLPCDFTSIIESSQISLVASVFHYKPFQGFFGTDQMKVIIKDKESNSELLTIKMYVLEHKCVHGSCAGPSADSDCQGTGRANGFSNYSCDCLPGYHGSYCELNIDDCASAACPYNTTCKDGVDSYQCICEPGDPCSFAPTSNLWWIALAVTVPVVFLLAVIGAVFLYRHKKTRNKVADSVTKLQPDLNDEKDGSKWVTTRNKKNQITPAFDKSVGFGKKYEQNWAKEDFDSWPEPTIDSMEMDTYQWPNDEFKQLTKAPQDHRLPRTAWQ